LTYSDFIDTLLFVDVCISYSFTIQNKWMPVSRTHCFKERTYMVQIRVSSQPSAQLVFRVRQKEEG